MNWKGKKILLGVSGSIAAYKAALLIREFVKLEAEVRVVMTQSATEFITPLTLATLSKNKVMSRYVANTSQGSWNNHVELGLWADVMVVAPATANTLAKMSTGITDNLLQAVYLSARCPVFICPAMDLDMYLHPSTQKNISYLKQIGHTIIDAEHGELASGLVGKGRMAEPENVVVALDQFFHPSLPLSEQKWLITAGPTHEPIDPVRFIGNRSSGKMGVALAKEAAKRGANVLLISGPGTPLVNENGIEQLYVQTAQEMYDATIPEFSNTDVAVLSAAVADYRPANVVDQKMKKKSNSLEIELAPTPDILKTLGSQKQAQKLIGFALETENEEANAMSKIKRKNLDMIVLNSLNDKGAGFGYDTNKISVINAQLHVTAFELKSKENVAIDIINEIEKL